MDRRYMEYLRGETWKRKANERLKIEGYRCRGCGCAGTPLNPLQVHHLHYKSVYSEDVWKDLVVLCKICHTNLHWILNRPIDEEGTAGWGDVLSFAPHVVEPSVNTSRVAVVYTPNGSTEDPKKVNELLHGKEQN